MFALLLSIEIFITIIVCILLIILAVLIFLKNKKKHNTFLANVMDILMKNKMENIQYNTNKKMYTFSFKYNEKQYFIKIINGGKKKGIVMTNPTTIFIKTYSSNYGPATKSEYATKLENFLSEPLGGTKIILIKNNMLRITKYINENELEEVKYNVPSFNTYIVQEKDLNNYLEYIKIKDKKK